MATSFLDYHGLQTFKGELDELFDGKVDKVTGKGLSTNDYTDADKALVQSAVQDVSDKMDANLKGVANGVAELDANGKVPSSQLPGYVDDVLEYASLSGFPTTGETGKIYVALDTDKTYRWSGTAYVEISASLALGETSSTAYRGDRGKTAYDHASAKGSAFTSGLYKITTNDQGHVTSATAVVKSDITALGIPGEHQDISGKVDKVTGKGLSTNDYTDADKALVQSAVQDISEKADKVENATNGNFAALDSTGNLVDSGHKHSDYLTQHQDISGKVDKVTGKGLSTNDYTDADKALVQSAVQDISGKVDKVTGKGLSTNDYTDADKALVQSAVQDISGKVDKVTGKGLSTNDYTDADKALVQSAVQDVSDKMDANLKGVANGVAELDSSGKVPSSQLPSYVDDVLEYASLSGFPATGETGKIYVALDTDKTYRWSGTTYVEISASLALGETSSTAYRGDRGKTAYDHATESGKVSAAVASGLYKVAVTAEGHVASLTPVQKSDVTALGIPGENTTYSEMEGATASTDGSSGLVPAPEAGDEGKFLKGDGTWSEVIAEGGSAKIVHVTGTIENTSGAYEETFTDNRVTSSMTPITIELSAPEIFGDEIQVSTGTGSLTISCSNVAGESTFKIGLINSSETTVTSEEYDELESMISDVADDVDAVNSKFSADTLSVSSIDTLKSALLAKANGMAQYETKFVTFWVSGTTTGFSTGKNYSGTITISSKTSNSLYFDVVLSAYDGDIVIVGYANGTWNINSLNSKLKTENYVNLGHFYPDDNELISAVSKAIQLINTGNNYTSFIGTFQYAGARQIMGFVYPNKDYGAGFIVGDGQQYQWSIHYNSITVNELALNSNAVKFIEGMAKVTEAVTWASPNSAALVKINVSNIITPSRVKHVLSCGIGVNPAGVTMTVAQNYNGNTGNWECYIIAANDQTVAADTDVYVKLLYV